MSKLVPTIAATPAALGDLCFDGQRRRPVVATNEKGETVVCCRRTAKKNGWALQGVAFARQRKAPAAP